MRQITSEINVFFNRICVKEIVLHSYTEFGMQLVRRNRTHVATTNADATGIHVIKTHQQRDKRSFTRAVIKVKFGYLLVKVKLFFTKSSIVFYIAR